MFIGFFLSSVVPPLFRRSPGRRRKKISYDAFFIGHRQSTFRYSFELLFNWLLRRMLGAMLFPCFLTSPEIPLGS